MPLVFGDRVKETSTSVGLGSFVLNGAATGFQAFVDGIGNGNQCFYTIENETDGAWEVGIGTVSGASLARDSVLSSSNSGSPVNFAAGTKQVFATEAAQHFNNALDATAHATIDHTGIPGVGGTETFTSATHASTNHTGLPGVPAAEVFTSAAHDSVDHTGAPFSLLDAAIHAALDHTGIPGVGGTEAYDQAAHDADDHTNVSAIQPPSQPVAEAGVEVVGRLWTAERVAQAIAAQTGLQVVVQFSTAVNTITAATGFTPKIAIFVGTYVGEAFRSIGYAIGTGGGNQATSVAEPAGATSLEGLAGSVQATASGGVAITQSHEVTTFNATQVQATQGTGATAWTGFVVVLGG